jgi:hypothetical protein
MRRAHAARLGNEKTGSRIGALIPLFAIIALSGGGLTIEHKLQQRAEIGALRAGAGGNGAPTPRN